jgi:hypothetical protein
MLCFTELKSSLLLLYSINAEFLVVNRTSLGDMIFSENSLNSENMVLKYGSPSFYNALSPVLPPLVVLAFFLDTMDPVGLLGLVDNGKFVPEKDVVGVVDGVMGVAEEEGRLSTAIILLALLLSSMEYTCCCCCCCSLAQ